VTFALDVRCWQLLWKTCRPTGRRHVDAAAAAFANWTSILAQSLREHGASAVDAHRTAVVIVAAVEGSVAMCRAQRGTQPLDDVAAPLHSLVAAHLPRR